jgi:uncharacterized protein YbbC (DUF1343 family)
MRALDTGAIDTVIDECIDRGDFPGAVVLVGHEGEVVYRRTTGLRMLVPEERPMRADTIFDLASVTKPLATASSVLHLIERGALSLQDPVKRYLPEFSGGEKDAVTIRHLLTHSAGIAAYHNYLEGGLPPDEIIRDICRKPLQTRPGTRLIYSCLGFILLREIVGIASGRPLDEYSREHIHEPLGMHETMFNPPPELRERCAATEKLPEGVLCGVVHDEDARALGGVGGNAGLFSTAADVSRFCQMVLNLGELDGVRVLSPATVRRATSRQSLHPGGARGLGWDIDSGYTPVIRGDVFPPGGVGHTGFTGTSVWIDPPSQTYIVVLTNRCHPTRDGITEHVRRGVANIVGAAFARPVPHVFVPSTERIVQTGLDRLAEEGAARLKGRRVGLIANHTAITRDRRHAVDVLSDAGVDIGALFSPEHGFRGEYDELLKVPSSMDEPTGLPIHSLYSTVQRPTDEMLEGIDTLVFDIADVGVRFYTYTTTMTYCMEEAAKRGIAFFVLDRPNPIDGVDVEGPILDPPFRSLAAYHRTATRHGMTAGELARFANAEYGIGCNLTVVECTGWERRMWFDETGLPWVNPSPNMRSLTQVTLYPAICPLEAANLSVGRGTDTPFEVFGASYIDGSALAEELNRADIPHLRFVPIQFVPESHKFEAETCGGCFAFTTDRRRLRSVRAAVVIASALTRMWPEGFDPAACAHLFGTDRIIDGLKQLEPPESIVADWEADEAAFLKSREPYLLYQ